MATSFRMRSRWSTLRSSAPATVRGSGVFSVSLSGTLGTLSGASTPIYHGVRSFAGSIGGFTGTLSKLFISGGAGVINILQHLRKRGDL